MTHLKTSSQVSSQIDITKLPIDYVTRKFYEYGYKVVQHGHNYCCCCPICREGNSWGKKQRCWWLPDKNLIYCFNCGHGYSPFNWIRDVSGMQTRDIIDEIRQNEYDVIDLDVQERNEAFESIVQPPNDDLPENSIDLSDKQQLDYYKNDSIVRKCLQYIHSRRLDTAVNRPDSLFLSLTDKVHRFRLVFPFKGQDGSTLFYQSRSIGAHPDPNDEYEKIRYLGKVGAKKTIFNIDKIDGKIKYVYVFEGPIDSCFVKNGVAVAGVSAGDKLDLTEMQLDQIKSIELMHRIVWVLDSQWLDETACDKTMKLLEAGETVFIWPFDIGHKYKDFNEMAIDQRLDEIPQSLLIENCTNNQAEFALKYNQIKNGSTFSCSHESVWSANLAEYMA